jgi:glycosyltransferase involved in cell wall biosynthesis
MRATLSIAMCTYNGARFLEAQLHSIAEQSRRPNELVVCDDDSTDETHSILNRFAKSAPFSVNIHRNPVRLGSTKNFERAIALTTGDLIALADQDDVWLPDKLEQLAQPFEREDVGCTFSDAEVVDQALRPVGFRLWQACRFDVREQRDVSERRAFGVLLRHNVITGATMMFSARHKASVLPIDKRWVQDGWIGLLISTQDRIVPVAKTLVKYRQHGGNQIGARLQPLSEELRISLTLGRDAYLREATRYEQLLGPLSAMDAPSECIQEVRNLVHHLRHRANLPSTFARRATAVAAETLRFGYHRYSNGWRSVIKDCVKG